MISKAQEKFIKSLQLKKNRKQAQLFLVEGGKSVLELLNTDFHLHSLLVTARFASDHPMLENYGKLMTITNEDTLVRLGTFQSNNAALAVVSMKANQAPVLEKGEYALVLDEVRDPGNLGTLLRIADWYGIRHVIASRDTADLYNPKVIHASMGSFSRVNLYYTDLEPYLAKTDRAVYGAFIEGTPVHGYSFDHEGLIVMGNEAHGIAAKLEKHIDKKISIPKFGKAESLNVAVATAIICDNLKRT